MRYRSLQQSAISNDLANQYNVLLLNYWELGGVICELQVKANLIEVCFWSGDAPVSLIMDLWIKRP